MSHVKASRLKQRDVESVKEATEVEEHFVDAQDRKCTDIFCLIVGVIFALLMFIITLIAFDNDQYTKANFPTDTDGKLCGIDYPGYKYVYFTDPTDITERVCVSRCPQEGDRALDCKSTETRGCNFNSMPGFGVQFYESREYTDRSGSFCIPEDDELETQVLNESKIENRMLFFNSKDTILMCTWISVIVSLVYFVVVQLIPKLVNGFILYVGALMLFILFVCTVTYPTEHTKSKVFVSILLAILLVIVVLTVFLFKDAVRANGVFLSESTKFVRQFPLVLINILIFMGMFAFFFWIMVLELNSIWTSSNLEFDPSASLYHEYEGSGSSFLTFLWIIQAIWGFNFLKESFNFIVSGYTTLWYYGKLSGNLLLPYRLYITKHLGSVIACAYMTGFFAIADAVFDLARGAGIAHNNTVCETCNSFFDLVRSEAMAYINLWGNPYCNSARYCEYLCDKSPVLEYSQSASRAYRIAAYSVLTGFTALLGLYVNGQISLYGMGLIMLISLQISNFFVQVNADSADATLMTYLSNEEFAKRNHEDNRRKNQQGFSREVLKDLTKDHGRTKSIIEELEKENLYEDQRRRGSSRIEE